MEEEDMPASTSTLRRGLPQHSSIGCSSLEDLPSMRQFEIHHKASSPEALEGWRKASLALNASRRFRYVANLKKRGEAEEALKQRRRFQISVKAVEAAWRFHDAGVKRGARIRECKNGFGIDVTALAEMVAGQDLEALRKYDGVSGVAQKLHTSEREGLCRRQLDKARVEAFGKNKYTETPPKGFWVFVWEALHDLTLIILGICAAVSLGIGIVTKGWREGWYDGAGIAFSIILVVFVTAASDYQQSLQFHDLDKEKKIFVEVTRDNCKQKICIFELLVGDIVHLKIGDQVPADGLYVSGCTVTIDESSMTGESQPKIKDENKPFLLSGTKVQDGSAKMLVTGVGMNTEWGHLMATLNGDGHNETPLQVKLNGVATLIGKIGLGFAVLTFLVLLGRFLYSKGSDSSFNDWSAEDALTIVNFFAIAVTIVVVAVPEGLPLAVTLTLAFAMKKMMADKALVRHLSACETMGSATVICSDKTGTLTSNKMTVVKAWVAGSVHNTIRRMKEELPVEVLNTLIEGSFLNSAGDISMDNDGLTPLLLGTPTDIAVLRFGLDLGGKFWEVCSESTTEKMEPFNSTRKKMGVVVRHGEDGKLVAHWKGASEIVLASCDRTVEADGHIVDLDEKKRDELNGVIKAFADQALRTLCLAFREVDRIPGSHEPIPKTGLVVGAIVGIKDPLRPGAKEAVRLCHEAGIEVRMVTGDNLHTAMAIARECSILTDDREAIEGSVFRKLPHDERMNLIYKLKVMARSSPTDKLLLVKDLQERHEVVAATGDGTNDAPALQKADIGLAMGISGTEVAKGSADVVILDDNFSTIVTVAKWGRSVYTNIQKFVQFQLTVNIVALILNFASACLTGSAPLTAVQLLWVNLIMDTLAALALATEPPYDALMKRPPVGPNTSFISDVMWRNIIGQVVYQLAALGILQYMGKEILHLTDDNADKLLNTAIFNTFVFCQVFNEVNAREMEKFNVFSRTFDNKIFLLIIGFTVIFQVIMVQFLGKFASTVPLNKEQWLITVSIGFLSLPIGAIVKLIPVPQGYVSRERVLSNERQPLLDNGYGPNVDASTEV